MQRLCGWSWCAGLELGDARGVGRGELLGLGLGLGRVLGLVGRDGGRRQQRMFGVGLEMLEAVAVAVAVRWKEELLG
jgi:hypothetical protein